MADFDKYIRQSYKQIFLRRLQDFLQTSDQRLIRLLKRNFTSRNQFDFPISKTNQTLLGIHKGFYSFRN